jgi:N-carbamoyl-L-amino-acid hydrolase
LVAAGLASSALAQTGALRVSASRIEQRIQKLSEFGRNPEGGVSRVAFSQADIEGRRYILGLMREAGLETSIDAGGNLVGRRAGSDASLKPIAFGSHIDSVPKGGNYDGDVGTIGAIECAQVLFESKVTTRHPIEVIVFADEEAGLIGSRAMVGDLGDSALKVVSHSGKTVGQGIADIGGDPRRIKESARRKGDVRAFLELHIEQGSFLYDEGVKIGVVEGIVGIQRWDVVVEGMANHAGTTPMNKRRDALLAAAQYVVAVNRVITARSGRQVGTVGRIAAEPGAHNVIPGRVLTSLEIRDLDAQNITRLYDEIRQETGQIEKATGARFTFTPVSEPSIPTLTDERLRRLIAQSAERLGLSRKLMPSGAGHDTQEMARIAPAAMIFVPSVEGISHSPKEFTPPEDMANGANVLLQTILAIDGGALDQ